MYEFEFVNAKNDRKFAIGLDEEEVRERYHIGEEWVLWYRDYID